jgi:hypothetical protein
MKKNRTRKLTLNRETVQLLQGLGEAANGRLAEARGGRVTIKTFSNTKMPEDCCL